METTVAIFVKEITCIELAVRNKVSQIIERS